MRPVRGLIRNTAVTGMLSSAALLGAPGHAHAQAPQSQAPASQSVLMRDEMLMHFEASMEKFISLAKAMPADKFTWSPGKGTMEVGHVYMHVANYNYTYLTQNMSLALPAGMKPEALEAVRAKADVVRALEESRAFVLDNVRKMPASELERATKLYGRDIRRWGVLVQLVSHMNEHLGQSIAYARMNGVVPPWSN